MTGRSFEVGEEDVGDARVVVDRDRPSCSPRRGQNTLSRFETTTCRSGACVAGAVIDARRATAARCPSAGRARRLASDRRVGRRLLLRDDRRRSRSAAQNAENRAPRRLRAETRRGGTRAPAGSREQRHGVLRAAAAASASPSARMSFATRTTGVFVIARWRSPFAIRSTRCARSGGSDDRSRRTRRAPRRARCARDRQRAQRAHDVGVERLDGLAAPLGSNRSSVTTSPSRTASTRTPSSSAS